MSRIGLGHTLVIANPTSHSGRGAQAAERVRNFFGMYQNATSSFEMALTQAPLEASEMAARAADKDTVIALGGDGVIHEVVNGLMAIDEHDRPKLGIIPMGSGNDYARTLGTTFNKPDTALAEMMAGHVRKLDLGCVVSDEVPLGPAGTPGTYFMETLSFGLDAAIAIDTTRRRAEGTKQEGSTLFLTSSIRLVAAGSAGYPCRVSVDGGEPIEFLSLILAVQNGPTYGGGFRICPSADPTDGVFELCRNLKKPGVPRLLALLALARFGRHTHSRAVQMDRARSLTVEFPERVAPCQLDGEELVGRRFEVTCVPQALDVIVPRTFRW